MSVDTADEVDPFETDEDRDRWSEIGVYRAELRLRIADALSSVYAAEAAHRRLVDVYDVEYAEAGSGDFAYYLAAAQRALRAAQALNPVKDGAR